MSSPSMPREGRGHAERAVTVTDSCGRPARAGADPPQRASDPVRITGVPARHRRGLGSQIFWPAGTDVSSRRRDLAGARPSRPQTIRAAGDRRCAGLP